ncbi:MAG TPA: cupin domain-containing protein [Gaiellaceae bacterium]|nr:cupin domain-containing protein [Gaiellaceae bacterium]
MSAFDDVRGMEPLRIWDGVAARAVHGDKGTMAIIELDPGSLVPEHRHANEQLGFVITGSVSFRVGDETKELGPGSTWQIPADVPHEVRVGPEGAVVVDVFAPGRDDWAGLERDEPREPRWP